MTRRILTAAVSLVLASGLAACGSGSDQAQRVALAGLNTPPPPTQGSPISPAGQCSNLTASLRPVGQLPAPGAMPANSYMAQIRRRGYLRVGVDQNTLLLSYLNPRSAQPTGFEIDLLHQLAKAILGNPNLIRFRAVTTDERTKAIQQGLVDVVADAFTITCKRKHDVDFSTVYYDAGQRLLVPLNSPIHSVADLAGRRVCATVGSTSLQTIEKVAPRAIPYTVAQRTDCLVALQEGQVDAITSDDAILLGFKAQDPNTQIVGGRLADEPYGMAVSKDHPDFVRFVNGMLARVRSDGTWASLYRKWLGQVSSTPSPPHPSYSG
jgi:polar amino acid transport system substrate-binding protein